jgi:predicted transcriptional regulator
MLELRLNIRSCFCAGPKALDDNFMGGLIRRAIGASTGCHLMKTTIEISDDLFARTQRLARKEKTTFRALTEAGLRFVLKEKQAKTTRWKWKPAIFHGRGLTDEFKNANWDKIRDEIYRGRGA